MSKTDNYLSEVKNRKLFDEQYKDSSLEDLAKESLYLQGQQLKAQSKTQKDIRTILIIGVVIIALNVIGYLMVLLYDVIFD